MIKWIKKLLLKKKVKTVLKKKKKTIFPVPKGTENVIDHLSEEMNKAESFIKDKREQFYSQLSQNVYYFNPTPKFGSPVDCHCTFTVELAPIKNDFSNIKLVDLDDPNLYAEVDLIPYSVCDKCREKLKREARPLRIIVQALKKGDLKIHTADSLRLRLEQKMLEEEQNDQDE